MSSSDFVHTRCAKKCSQVALNRRRKMAMCAAPKHLKLYDFVTHRKNKIKHIPPVNLKLGQKPVSNFFLMWCTIKTYIKLIVQVYFINF